MRLTPRHLASWLTLAASVACSESVAPARVVVPQLEVVAGSTPLTLAVNSLVTPSPSVRVTDAEGTPLAGVTVLFVPTAGIGLTTGAHVITGADGIATVGAWRYAIRPGPQALTAAIVSATVDARAVFPGTAVAGPVARIVTSPRVVAVAPGSTLQLSVNSVDAFGNLVGSGVAATFASVDPGIATVSGTGLVTAVSMGTTAVITSFIGLSDTVYVSVSGRPQGTNVVTSTLPGRPFGVAIAPQGTAYIGRVGAANLARYQLPGTDSAGSIALPGPSYDIAFSPNGNTAYTVNPSAGSVSVIDRATHTLLRSIPGLGEPFRVRASPSGAHVFVGTSDGEVHRINTSTDAVQTLSAGGVINGLAVNAPRGVLYASSTSGLLHEIDLATFTLLRTAPIAGPAQGLSVSPDGSVLFLANEGAGAQIVSVVTLAVTATIANTTGAFDVAVTPDGTELYVTQPGAGRVSVVDLATQQVIRTHLGGVPRRMAFSVDGLTLVVVNESGWITFIR